MCRSPVSLVEPDWIAGMGRPRETGIDRRLSRLQLAHATGIPEATLRGLEARGVLPPERIPALAPIQARVAVALPQDQAGAASETLGRAWDSGRLTPAAVLVVADGTPMVASSLISSLPLVERAAVEARVFPVGAWLADGIPAARVAEAS